MARTGVRLAALAAVLALGAQPALFEPPRHYYKARGAGVTVRWEVPAPAAPEGRALAVALVVSRVQNPVEVVRPDLSALPAFAERFEVAPPAAPPAINGTEVRFAYTLRPRSRAVDRVPALDFYYFNPAAAAGRSQYRLTRAESVPIRVTDPPPKPAVPLADPEHLFALPPLEPGAPFAPCGRAWAAAALFGPLAALGWFLAWRRVYPGAARLAHLRRSRAARRALDAVRRAGRAADPPAATAAALLDYLRARFPVPESAATPGEIGDALRAAAVPPELAAFVADVFRACDRARFAPDGAAGPALAADAEAALFGLEELA